MPMSSEIIPTRPRNIAVHKSIFDDVPSIGVMPREEPTVNREDNYLELLEKERDFYGNYDYESIYRGLEVRE